MSHNRELIFEWTLIGLLLILGGLLFVQAMPFLNGALGAITLYILLRRTNIYLANRISPNAAPWILTIAVAIFVILPFSAGIWYLIELINNLDFDINVVVKRFTDTIKYLENTTKLDLVSEKSISFATAKITGFMNTLVAGINEAAINLFTALLLLFFLLAGGIRMERGIARCLPFNDRNKTMVINKVSTIVKSNAIGIPLLAMIQGSVATVGYYLCGVNNPIEFGVLTGFASMIPIVGSMLVWIPLAIVQYFEQGILPAIYVALYGVIVISQSDNVLRMIVQKRMANTHPLITIFGVVAGLPLFGFMGLIFGPLVVAMFLLFLEMFIKQYITCEYAQEDAANAANSNGPTGPTTPNGSRRAHGRDKWALQNANPNAPQNQVNSARKNGKGQQQEETKPGLLDRMLGLGKAKAENTAKLRDNTKNNCKRDGTKRDSTQRDSSRDGSASKRDAYQREAAQREETERNSSRSTKRDSQRDSQRADRSDRAGRSDRAERDSKQAAAKQSQTKDGTRNSSRNDNDQKLAEKAKAPSDKKSSVADSKSAAKSDSAKSSKDVVSESSRKSDFKTAKADAKQQKREAAKMRAAEEQKAQEREVAREVLSNEHRPAVNLADMLMDSHDAKDAAGRTLVARAVSDAIGSFEKFDDLESTMHSGGDLFKDDYLTDETKAAIAKKNNRRGPKPSANFDDDSLSESIKHKTTSDRDDTAAASAQTTADAVSGSTETEAKPKSSSRNKRNDGRTAAKASGDKADGESSARSTDRQSRRQRNKDEQGQGSNSSSRNDKRTSDSKRNNERKQGQKDATRSSKTSAKSSRRTSRERRALMDEYYGRSSRRNDSDLPRFETVVAYGANGGSKRPQLRTQLVSMYTAKGTVKAEPRRRPSKKRPHHR